MLQYLLLTAAVALGQPEGDPSPATPAPSPRATLALEADASQLAAPPPPPPPAAAADNAPPAWLAAAPDNPPKPKPPEPLNLNVVSQPPAPPAAAAAAAAAAPTYPPRFILMKELQGTWPGALLDGTRTYITGWEELSYTFGTVGHSGLPETFNYRQNEPAMQQTWIRIARPVVNATTTNGTSYAWPTATTEPTFGFESDTIIGTDYRFTLPQKGLLAYQLTDRKTFNVTGGGSEADIPNIYGVDPVQFYGEAYFPTVARGLDVKVGRFYTPYGVESLEAVSTPLISHDYIFSNGSPFTHTGILATLTLTDAWTVQAGAVIGDDLFFYKADKPTGIFTVQWTQPHGTQNATPQPFARNIVKFTAVQGPGRFDDETAVNNINIVDVVWTHQFNAVMLSYLEALYGYEYNVRGQSLSNGTSFDPGFTNWGGMAGYLQYIFSGRLTGTVRAELFDDPQGFRTSTAEDPFLDRTKGLYGALTAGAQWKIRPGLWFEPELRYDYNFNSAPFGSTIDHPLDGHNGMFTAAGAMIVRW
jgi:hypothetical protein